jgi:hypothetical protein
MEGSSILQGHPTFKLNHQWAAPVGRREPHLRIGKHLGALPALGDGRHAQPAPKQRQEQHQSGRDEQRDVDTDGIG